DRSTQGGLPTRACQRQRNQRKDVHQNPQLRGGCRDRERRLARGVRAAIQLGRASGTSRQLVRAKLCRQSQQVAVRAKKLFGRRRATHSAPMRALGGHRKARAAARAFRQRLQFTVGEHVFAPTVTLLNPESSVVGKGTLPWSAGFTQS